MSLFPELDPPSPPPIIVRWIRLVATLGPEGSVVAVQLDATTVDGILALSRGFWPTSGRPGEQEPLRTMIRFGQELTMD